MNNKITNSALSTHLTPLHFLLALLVVAVWGSNFVVIKLALDGFPPILFAAFRYVAATIPFIFFFKRPAVSWSNLFCYGMLIGVGQFVLLFIAMDGYISAGLASLLMQSQIFFTIALAMFLAKEVPRFYQICAISVAVIGMLIIALHTDGDTSLTGIILVLFASLSWGIGNIVSRNAILKASQPINMLSYMIWTSMFSIIPLFLLSFYFYGYQQIKLSIEQANLFTWLAVLWQAYGNTLFGYGIWAWLLGKYSAITITPMALLTPIFGFGASIIILNEDMPSWKLTASLLVLLGLAINILWPHFKQRIKQIWR